MLLLCPCCRVKTCASWTSVVKRGEGGTQEERDDQTWRCREVTAGFTPPLLSTAFLNFLCVNLQMYSVPLCMHPLREWLSSVPTRGCDCNRLDYFLSLPPSLSILLALLHSLSSLLSPSSQAEMLQVL